MIQSKEYIIHQIADDIKTHIGQKYIDKSNIDWGLYTGLLGLIVFCFTAVRLSSRWNEDLEQDHISSLQ